MIACADLPHFVKHDSDFNLATLSFDTYANNIEIIRAELGFKQVVIVGHSHHGNVALEYAKRFPNKVSHVIIISSPPVDIAGTIKESELYWATYASVERKTILKKNRAAISADHLTSLSPEEAYIVQYVADAPMYWYDPNYDASWLWLGMHFDLETIHAFRDLFGKYRMTWDTAYLKAPVLVVIGRHDYVVPHTLWEEKLPKLQNVTYKLLDRSGHTPQLEESQMFDQILLDWLQRNSGHAATR
jgi:proline iminopeptidase